MVVHTKNLDVYVWLLNEVFVLWTISRIKSSQRIHDFANNNNPNIYILNAWKFLLEDKEEEYNKLYSH